MNIAIVTDSTADIPAAMAEERNISIIPAMVVVGETVYQDGKGITREEFYRNLPSYPLPPTTSSPSMGVYQQLYRFLLDRGATEIISIHASSTFSGLHDIACA